MPAPFYNSIKGNTAGAAGTGAYTPSGNASGFEPWAGVPAGWTGMVRFEDGSTVSREYCYWNGTTLSRSTNQLAYSSTGSLPSLSSAATAAMIVDASEIMAHPATTQWRGWLPNAASTAFTNIGTTNAPTVTGTAGAVTPAPTNYLTEQCRIQITSATTANAQAGVANAGALGVVNTTTGRGGVENTFRFGASVLPTGPRLFVGLTATTFVGNTGEPSALASNFAVFGKDSTDTNIQLMTNNTGVTANKVDTGIPLVANGWYEGRVWCEPGSNKVYGLLMRLDTGAIWFGSTTTNPPASGAALHQEMVGGLSSTTGTAFILHFGSQFTRSGQ